MRAMMSVKRVIDISWPISETMTAYKNQHEVKFADIATFSGDNYRKSRITMSSHDGTHVDAPSHFVEHGSSIDQLPLTSLVGSCKVIDVTHVEEKITQADIAACDINAGDIILFKTKNSFLSPTAHFNPQFVFIQHDAAQFLADKKIKAVGVDYLGIERSQPGHETHISFFSNNIAVVEGLRLGDVEPGAYFFCCLPLNIQGLEGAPARAVLFQD